MTTEPPTRPAAFLVRRIRGRWQEVHQLPLGQSVTLGRADTNRIVIDDTRCSRRHCEVSYDGTDWWVRDLDSANGTDVNGQRVTQPHKFVERDILRVCGSEFMFTLEVSQPLEEELLEVVADECATEVFEPETEIFERRSRSAYQSDPQAVMRLKHDLACLYRLISRLVAASDVRKLCDDVVDGLREILKPDLAAILLFDTKAKRRDSVSELRIISFRAPEDGGFFRVSDRLSTMALKEKFGILALDVGASKSTSDLKTLEAMSARHVICVPIRDAETTYGLIHLYSMQDKSTLDADALEFALAVAEHAAVLLKKLISQESLTTDLKIARTTNQSLRTMLRFESETIGDSPVMQRLRSEIAQYAASDATVLICGESGVGKELVARSIHFNSNRQGGPFVCVNCAALSESLLESELFGHEKGSFTGATERRVGKFEQATGGTLFLDEIGEMSQTMQAKFLRVLEGQPFERVGGTTPVKVNVRVVAATNRDLPTAVRDGDFRKDLYFRLNVLQTLVPPLRQRREDIAELVTHFLHLASSRLGRAPKTFSADALTEMEKYDWPGNVRELRNVVERAFTLATTGVIGTEHLHFSHLNDRIATNGEQAFDPVSIEEMEKRHIHAMMLFTKWVKREAARLLDIERSTLDRKLAAYKIERPTDL